jgi:hypothetical protein
VQDGLRLISGMVSSEHHRELLFPRRTDQKVQPRPPSGLFQAASGISFQFPSRQTACKQRDSKLFRSLPHQRGIPRTCSAPQVVIQMCGSQSPLLTASQIGGHPQQHHAVDTSGNGNQQSFTCTRLRSQAGFQCIFQCRPTLPAQV